MAEEGQERSQAPWRASRPVCKCKETSQNVGTMRAMLDQQGVRLDAMEKAQQDMEKDQKREMKDMWAAMKSHRACINQLQGGR